MKTLPLMLLAAAALAQERQFEVASIKRSQPGATVQDARMDFPKGRFEAVSVTLNNILEALAFFQGKIQGAPGWAASERYDISAKADGEIAPDERGPMVMALLVDRFKLKVHHETKEESGLALAVGKEAPKMAAAKPGEAPSIRVQGRQVWFQAADMFTLTNYLRNILRLPVVDHTGLAGKFDFTVDADGEGTFADRLRAGIEHFGFKVEGTKVKVDVTVIDHAEPPTEN